MSVQNGERLATKQDLADMYQGILPYLSGGGSTVLLQTLIAGDTSVTFSNLPTNGNFVINFYTSTGINYNAINTATAGQVTLTYEAQSINVTVFCEIKEVAV